MKRIYDSKDEKMKYQLGVEFVNEKGNLKGKLKV